MGRKVGRAWNNSPLDLEKVALYMAVYFCAHEILSWIS